MKKEKELREKLYRLWDMGASEGYNDFAIDGYDKRREEYMNEIIRFLESDKIKGEWIEDGYYDYPYYVCSNCGQECGTQYNGVEIEPLCTKYCPNCGAKMKGGTENE